MPCSEATEVQGIDTQPPESNTRNVHTRCSGEGVPEGGGWLPDPELASSDASFLPCLNAERQGHRSHLYVHKFLLS